MNIRKSLVALAATAALLGGASAAFAAPGPSHYGYQERGHRVDRRAVFDTLRFHHIRYVGEPFYISGHYVVRAFDRFGRGGFMEVDPQTGMLIGFFRL